MGQVEKGEEWGGEQGEWGMEGVVAMILWISGGESEWVPTPAPLCCKCNNL